MPISGNDDDLLLLTMRLDTNEDDFSKARQQVKQLQDSLRDTSSSIGDLGGFVSGLKEAVAALRIAVKAWNSLENKAISVATARNYLPFGISSGEAESISTKIDANKSARKLGWSGASTLSVLANIAQEQSNITTQGMEPNSKSWIALSNLGRIMGDNRFQGEKLSSLLTTSTSSEVLNSIAGLVSNASRRAYSLKGEQRQELLGYISQVKNSPYVPAGMIDWIMLMTNPDNATWGKSGIPTTPLLSATVDDLGNYGKTLGVKGAKSLDISSAISYNLQELKESINSGVVTTYNSLGELFVLPFTQALANTASLFSGKKLDNMSIKDLHMGPEEGVRVIKEAMSSKFARRMGSAVLLDSTGTVSTVDTSARGGNALAYSLYTDNAILGELGLYEYGKLAQANYSHQALATLSWAKRKLIDSGLSSSEAEKQLKGKYADAFAEGGFTGLYRALYAGGAVSSSEYLDIMASVINNTKHDELNRYNSNIDANSEVTAKTTQNSLGQTVLRLELTVVNPETGARDVSTVDLTPEQLSSVQMNIGGL